MAKSGTTEHQRWFSPGITVVSNDYQPATAPERHRGYKSLTRGDLTKAGKDSLRILAIGDGTVHCVITQITDISPEGATESDVAVEFKCATRTGQLLLGRVSVAECTSFRPRQSNK
ncbi:MAG: hypothetical protein JWN01_992 [Patescibacteria group bacterium]|nr:hypothetical protein [Patescibacteria group bacterium]